MKVSNLNKTRRWACDIWLIKIEQIAIKIDPIAIGNSFFYHSRTDWMKIKILKFIFLLVYNKGSTVTFNSNCLNYGNVVGSVGHETVSWDTLLFE